MLKNFSVFFSFIVLFISQNVWAGNRTPSLIRDAETEKFLRELSRPIFLAANLNPENIALYIVNDDSINAFVSGGQNVFVNTGLIRKYKTPDTLIGVIAHESGHIAAGHLARNKEGAESAEGAMLLSYLLGIGAALGGSPDAAMALILGGSQSATRLYMTYNRGQEEAADNHAIEYLSKMQYPADGLVTLLQSFEREMIGYKGQIDEYLLSHPISKKRIELIKNRTAEWKFSDQKINQELQPQMTRVLAKLEGFMENPETVLRKYFGQNDENSNYIKSIAFFRKGEIGQSLKLLDAIIDKYSNITLQSHYTSSELGFLYELRGQILFESGRIFDASLAYDKAIKLLKDRDAAQARIAFGSSILALPQDDKDLLKLAIKRFEEAKKFEENNPLLMRNMAVAYNKIGQEGKSLLALAQFNCMIGEKEKCIKYAKQAKNKLAKSNKADALQADDLIDGEKKKE